MKSKLTLLFSLLIIGSLQAQEVPRKVVVEHFTNTLCSICASRNPGFYTNYTTENTGNMLHLAIHPSSPYSACIFNKHNKIDNDERTKYYGVFGSTPRLVINGSPIPASTSYNSPTIFAPYVGLMSPIKLTLSQQKTADSIYVKVVVTTVAANSLGQQNLYVVLAEDTIFYNAPNGENQHYDVMRKSLFGDTGSEIMLPLTVGDSLVFTASVAVHADWNYDRIYGMAILENKSDKSVTQAEAISPKQNDHLINGVERIEISTSYKVYPNPVQNTLTIQTELNGVSNYSVISISGNTVLDGSFSNQTQLNISNLPNGVYFLAIENANGFATKRFIKISK